MKSWHGTRFKDFRWANLAPSRYRSSRISIYNASDSLDTDSNDLHVSESMPRNDRFALRLLADAAIASLLLEAGMRLEWVLFNLDHAVLPNLQKMSSCAELLMWGGVVAGAELGLNAVLNYVQFLREERNKEHPSVEPSVTRPSTSYEGHLKEIEGPVESLGMFPLGEDWAKLSLRADGPLAEEEEEDEDDITPEEVPSVLDWLHSLDLTESYGAVSLVWKLARSHDESIRLAVAEGLGGFPCYSNGWISALQYLAHHDQSIPVRTAALRSFDFIVDEGILTPPPTSPIPLPNDEKNTSQRLPSFEDKDLFTPLTSTLPIPKVLSPIIATRVHQESSEVLELPDSWCVVESNWAATLSDAESGDRSLVRSLTVWASLSILFELFCIISAVDSPLRFMGLGWVLAVSLGLSDRQDVWQWAHIWRRQSFLMPVTVRK
mmetsp:Transcript_12370/g.20932  ORF Transcript_12370/g.20932 Transcript_12370/m.20932 type:complete len:435 (+) Transcript_12370:93-1397(+)